MDSRAAATQVIRPDERVVRLVAVEEVLHRLPGSAEVVDLVVLGDPREPDVDVPVEGDVLVEVGAVPHPARGLAVRLPLEHASAMIERVSAQGWFTR